MIRRAILWLRGRWLSFYERKVEQARAPQMPELEWMRRRAGRIEAELKSVQRGGNNNGEAWRAR